MNFPLLFPSFVIFVCFFWRVSCDMDLDSLKAAIASDYNRIVKKYLDGENRQRVLHEALIKAEERDRWKKMMERTEPRPDSRIRLPGNAALHWAVIKRAPKVTRLLLENGANVNMLNFQGQTPLFLAASQNVFVFTSHEKIAHENVIETLLKFNPDIHIRNDLGLTPLLCAAGGCNVSLVAKLLARGANINDWWMGRRKTPLHRAVYYGCVEMTKFLLENGAEASADNIYGENALHIIFDTRELYFTALGAMGKEQAAIAKLLLRSEKAENMLKQRENRLLKTPVDIFFRQTHPNREILVDLLKTVPSLDHAYAISALHIFSPSLEQRSFAWPLENFPEYVKIAFNCYMDILSKDKSEKTCHLQNAFAEFERIPGCSITNVKSIFPTYDIKFFIENGLYSLYVILRAHFQIRRGRSREEATEEVEKFDQYLRELSVPFQNALSNAVTRGTTLEILPADTLTKIFQHWKYIERMAKIMSLVQFTGTQRLSVEEMADAVPAFMNLLF